MKRSISMSLVLGIAIVLFCCTKDESVTPDLNQNDQDTTITQIEYGSFDFKGHNRKYNVFLPGNYSDTINLPMVIYLHSYDWNAKTGKSYTQMYSVADTSSFIVVYPDAFDRRWNSGIADNPEWPTPNVDDVGFINALIDTLSNYYSIDLERIYACGFSNGGFMSYKLACQLSHRIAAIASVAGVMSTGTADNCNSLHTMPVLHIHGTDDNLVPFGGGAMGWHSVVETISYWTDFNDCDQENSVSLPDLDPTDGCTVDKVSYSSSSNESNVILYIVHNGGHSWPSAASDPPWAGKRTNDINANVEIWNFFKNYKLDL